MRHDQFALRGRHYAPIIVMIGSPCANQDSISWDQTLSAQMRAANSDRRTRQDVIAELKSEGTIDIARIGVHVRDGVVTLTGGVDGYGDQWLIQEAAHRAAGVRTVVVALTVRQPEPDMRSDDGLRRECEQELAKAFQEHAH